MRISIEIDSDGFGGLNCEVSDGFGGGEVRGGGVDDVRAVIELILEEAFVSLGCFDAEEV